MKRNQIPRVSLANSLDFSLARAQNRSHRPECGSFDERHALRVERNPVKASAAPRFFGGCDEQTAGSLETTRDRMFGNAENTPDGHARKIGVRLNGAAPLQHGIHEITAGRPGRSDRAVARDPHVDHRHLARASNWRRSSAAFRRVADAAATPPGFMTEPSSA